jgi:hypothetical protein
MILSKHVMSHPWPTALAATAALWVYSSQETGESPQRSDLHSIIYLSRPGTKPEKPISLQPWGLLRPDDWTPEKYAALKHMPTNTNRKVHFRN